jgi:hypothetical protein
MCDYGAHIHDTWVADGTRQNCTQSPLALKHLPHHGTNACCTRRKGNRCLVSVTSDSLLHVGACFKSFAHQALLISSKVMGVSGAEIRTVGKRARNPPSL